MAELNFYSGTMDCGKSTLALQMDHNHRASGRVGRVFTSRDRAGESTLSSRLGLVARQVRYEDIAFWRNPVVAVFTFAFPLVFMVLAQLVFAGRVDIEGTSPALFYTPAIVAFTGALRLARNVSVAS